MSLESDTAIADDAAALRASCVPVPLRRDAELCLIAGTVGGVRGPINAFLNRATH